ncbi:MAG TPA: IS66 family insertion sequence element accessory protein TnpB [Gemmatales bacterium]|nr:IS66 family insertion sequence element accessory protein TnpB [Gemmatales bacterium]
MLLRKHGLDHAATADPGVLCLAPTDMRKSFDGLASVVSSTMAADPLAGDLFVFRGKHGDRIKLLYWECD